MVFASEQMLKLFDGNTIKKYETFNEMFFVFYGPKAALVRLAKNNTGVIVPGYTHLQRAQPVLLQHHLLAYVEQV